MRRLLGQRGRFCLPRKHRHFIWGVIPVSYHSCQYYNFSKITSVTISYPYPYSCLCFLVFLHLVQTLEGLFLWKEWNLFLGGGSRSVQFVIKVVEWDVRRGSKSDRLR